MSYKLIVACMLLFGYSLMFSPINVEQVDSSQSFLIRQDDRGMSVEAFMRKVYYPDKLVLVYFHANWCLPCVKLKPEIEVLEKEQQEVCEVLKIDSDQNPQLNEYFEINTLPLFILYKNGKKVWENTGYQSKQQLQSKIEQFQKK